MKNRSVAVTNEVRILKYMRINSGLSLRQAAARLNVTDTAISHIENGKMKLPYKRIEQMALSYGFSMNDFFKFCGTKNMPRHRREECEGLLRRVPVAKLDVVLSLLKDLTQYDLKEAT